MSYSIQSEVSDGTLSSVTVGIKYIDRTDIHLYIDDIEMDTVGGSTPYLWDWINDSTISITPIVPNLSVVLLRRRTPLVEMYHNFNSGAVFKDTSVDENFLQTLHLAQEALEGGASADFYNDLDLHGYVISNSGPAVLPGDLISLEQYQADADGSYQNRLFSLEYANAAKNVEVEPGKYSAFHWSEVAKDNVAGVGSVNGRTGIVTLAKSDVGLSNVDNTSDINKPVSTAQADAITAALVPYAPLVAPTLNSPSLTGAPRAQTLSELINVIGNVSGATTVFPAAAGYMQATTTGAVTWDFNMLYAPAGYVMSWTLELVNGGAFAQTWTGVKWPNGEAPSLTASGVDILVFTYDGTNLRGALAVKDSR